MSGRYIVNSHGDQLAIRGFNSFGTAQNCNLYFGAFDNGSHVTPNMRRYNRSVLYFERLKQQWNVNAFRIMVNEYCWLNREDIKYRDRANLQPTNTGTDMEIDHERALIQVVEALRDNNMIAIITLGAARDTVQRVNGNPVTDVVAAHPTKKYIDDPSMAMPNYRNSKAVWESLVDTFKGYPHVIFDPYNEPHPYLCNQQQGAAQFGNDCVSGCGVFEYDLDKSMMCMVTGDDLDPITGNPRGTACSGNGGGTNGDSGIFIPNSCVIRPPPMAKARSTPQIPTSGVLGIKTIIDIIRGRGATNLIVVPGAVAAGDARKWKQYYMPGGVSIDPMGKLVASVHRYSFFGSSSDACSGSTPASCHSKLETDSLKENGVGSLLGETIPIIYGEFGSQVVTDATADIPSNNCENMLFVPSMVTYAVSKQQGMMFHDATALRNPAISIPPNGEWGGTTLPNNKPCSNFQAFADYGEGVDADGVFDNNNISANNTIEPTVYGKQFKDNTVGLSWTWGTTVPDTTPNPFNFTPTTNVPLGSTQRL